MNLVKCGQNGSWKFPEISMKMVKPFHKIFIQRNSGHFLSFFRVYTEPDDFKEPWHYTHSHKKLYRIHKSHVTLCYITNITNYRTHYEREIALKEHEQTIAGRKSENKN